MNNKSAYSICLAENLRETVPIHKNQENNFKGLIKKMGQNFFREPMPVKITDLNSMVQLQKKIPIRTFKEKIAYDN